MSDEPMSPPAPLKPRRRLTLVEFLVVIAIIAVLIALLLPEPQWAADGSREFPVRVFVFDLASGKPISNAEVAVVTICPQGVYSVETAAEAAKEFVPLQDHLDFVPTSQKGRTDQQGVASLMAEVRTGSGNKHPKPRAYPARCWVVVSAPGFGSVAFPLGQEAVLTSELRERGGFLVPIGIMRDPAK